jgi:hypothetical protein
MNPSMNQPQPVQGANPQAPAMPYAAPQGMPQQPAMQPQPQMQPAQPMMQQQMPQQQPMQQQPMAPVQPQPQYQMPQTPLPQNAAVSPAGPGVKPMQPHANPNSTQNMLQIAEIRDGIVIMSDGSYRTVIMVKSINFDLMSPQEQEGVEYSYQSFLNSLYFPIQIFVRSQKVDIGPYIEKLDKIRAEHDNMLLALLMEDYIGYMESLAQQTNIMDKKFYIVIPFFPHESVVKATTQSKNFVSGMAGLFSKASGPHVVINEEDLEKAKSELRNRVQAVLGGLLQSQIQGLPLDTQELIELYYDSYNPDTATRQQLKNFNELNADYIVKGGGRAPQPHLDRELI